MTKISRLIVLIVIVLSGCAVDKQEETPQFLLIVRERLRPGSEETVTECRRDLSSGSVLRIAGARFLVIDTAQDERIATGVVFQATDGTRFVIASADNRSAAENLAQGIGPEGIIPAVQPQWSFPAESWIDVIPSFGAPILLRAV